MAPVRIGVMGCADIARRRMLPAIATVPGAELAAVASRDPDKAAELAARYGCRPVHGYSALLELPGLDAVYIPLPAAMHAEWTEAALRAGKHVLAEKPVATDPRRTSGLLRLARASGLALMENVMFVHHRQHAAVRRLVADGAIGELRSFHAAFAVPELPEGNIRYARALGGGALWDTGVYPVRAALHFLGPSLWVAGAVLAGGPGREVATSGAALLQAPSGVSAQLTFGLEHAYRSRYTLWGSSGRITVDHAFTPPADRVPVLRLERRSATEEITLEPDDQVANTVSAFVAAVRAGATPKSPASQATIRQAELLAQIARRAAAIGVGADAPFHDRNDHVKVDVAT
jgi:predicted dehydrogenase